MRQATVRTYDAADRSGSLLADDGTVHPFGGDAVDGVVRLLRPGQRVDVRLGPDGEVAALTLPGFPLP